MGGALPVNPADVDSFTDKGAESEGVEDEDVEEADEEEQREG